MIEKEKFELFKQKILKIPPEKEASSEENSEAAEENNGVSENTETAADKTEKLCEEKPREEKLQTKKPKRELLDDKSANRILSGLLFLLIFFFLSMRYINKKAEILSFEDITTSIATENVFAEITSKADEAQSSAEKININTAEIYELVSLNGIGEVKAKAIIEYRNKNGAFSDISEIMNVSGIGKATFEKVKDYICLE